MEKTQKLVLQELKRLDFLRDRDGRFISAASGLVKIGDTFCIVADDQLSLGIFNLGNETDCKMVPLQAGQLPEAHQARKKVKPDWEALVPIVQTHGHSILLAVPSGSTKRRTLGIVIELDQQNNSVVKPVDFSSLYGHLELQFPDLNIEGAAVSKNRLKLFQRGNGKSAQNAVIDLNLAEVIADIKNFGVLKPDSILQMTHYDLGQLRNVSLSFTDACYCPDGNLFFLAAAEGGLSTYDDGDFVGAVLGRIDNSGKVANIIELDCPFKPEGLWVEKDNGGYSFYIVTDADNSEQVSALYRGRNII